MDIILWGELALFVILIGLSGFFSSAETSLFSLSKIQTEQLRREGHASLHRIERLLSQPRRLLVIIFLLRFFPWLLYPILLVFSLLTRLLAMLVGDRTGKQNPCTLRGEIFALMQMSTYGGNIDSSVRAMTRRLFNFGKTTVSRTMMLLVVRYREIAAGPDWCGDLAGG
jgi:CBS domain containing-hemolysin-like protein